MASEVLETCGWVASEATHVTISPAGVAELAAGMDDVVLRAITSPKAFDAELHLCDLSRPELTAQYLLVVDALNFCFWLDEELEYEHLAGGIKAAVLRDPHAIDAERLARVTGEELQELVGWERPLPLQGERARLLREVGRGLLESYGGQAANLVRAANRSAARLVRLVTAVFPGFRDHAIYRGALQARQVFFYKRAQIFVGDVWGAFGGQGLGAFDDIHCLTMFADYRVPVVLRELGVLQYNAELAQKVDSLQQLAPGSAEEIEIRAATVVAVDQVRQAIANRLAQQASQQQQGQSSAESRDGQQEMEGSTEAGAATGGAGGSAASPGSRPQVPLRPPTSIEVDWWLWEQGEKNRRSHRPHHRTLTVYY